MKQRPASGFTFIELIVVIAVMVILLGGGIAGFIRFNDRQRVTTAAKDIQGLLRAAQKKAQVQEIPSGCNTLQAYRVTAPAGVDGATVQLVARCGASKYDMTDHTSTRTELTLPEGVSLVEDLDVEFFTLQGGVAGADTIGVTGSTFVYEFKVSQGGEITEGGIADGGDSESEETGDGSDGAGVETDDNSDGGSGPTQEEN